MTNVPKADRTDAVDEVTVTAEPALTVTANGNAGFTLLAVA